jgi:DNA-binding transcriptional LysR family regulator
MLDVRKLVMLRAIAIEGSIAGAARSLNYTRPAVSQQLTALEAETGAKLLSRDGNRVRLTPAGASLVENTERILIELRTAEAMLDSAAGEVRGRLRVGVPFREGPGIMGRALRAVRERYPRLELQLIHVSSEEAPNRLRDERLDLAIASRVMPWPAAVSAGLREWSLGADPLCVYVAADHPLASSSACRITQLRDEPWILGEGTTLGRLTTALCNAAGFEPVVAALVDDVSIAVRLVGSGWGVTIAPGAMTTVPESPIAILHAEGVEAVRESVLLVRQGEEAVRRFAVTIDAVRKAAIVLRHHPPLPSAPH